MKVKKPLQLRKRKYQNDPYDQNKEDKSVFYQLEIDLRVKEKPDSKTIKVNGLTGRILKVERAQDNWILTVRFRSKSMIELMVVTEGQVVSKGIH